MLLCQIDELLSCLQCASLFSELNAKADPEGKAENATSSPWEVQKVRNQFSTKFLAKFRVST